MKYESHHFHCFSFNALVLLLPDIFKFKTLQLMFRANKNKLPPKIQAIFVKHNENDYCTRQIRNFKQRFARTSLKARACSIIGVILWNNLSCEFKDCNTLHSFKRKLKFNILSSY